MLKILRILVPINFSKESSLAIDWAKMIAGQQTGATLYLLHVLPPHPSGFGSVGYEIELEETGKRLEAERRQLGGKLLSFALMARGNIANAVARLCAEKDIDLVVMTTRGRRGFKHFLPESATEETIRVAPCPVLVLHLNSKNKSPKTGGLSHA